MWTHAEEANAELLIALSNQSAVIDRH